MKKFRRYLLVSSFLLSVALPPQARAQGAFDGFRVGLDATWAQNSVRMDASEPRTRGLLRMDNEIDSGRGRLSQGHAALSDLRSRIAEGEKQMADGQRQMEEARTAQAALKSSMGVESPMLAARIRDGQAALAAGEVQMRSARTAVAETEQWLRDGEQNIAEALLRRTSLAAFPVISFPRGESMGVRLSAGWGITLGSRFYLGIEADAGTANISWSINPPEVPSAQVRVNSVLGAQMKIGFLVLPNLMAFGTFGGQASDWEIRRRGAPSSPERHWQGGFRFGGGIEYAIPAAWLPFETRHRVVLRASYERTEFQPFSHSGARFRSNMETVRVGFSYLF